MAHDQAWQDISLRWRRAAYVWQHYVWMLDLNMKCAFTTICDEYCTKGMQQWIETHPNYATRIKDHLIVLLEEIQKLMHEMVQAQYNILTFLEAIKAHVNINQKDREELLDFIKRLKQIRTT